ncbi:MAG: relaxase/mobilization nuclease domain-containing protein [Flavobacteriales bacterium]|nr:relaxase/mobilization nuclease domain-containing protein [Flavobacteriales bacterium]
MIIKSLPKKTVNYNHLVEYVLTDGGKSSELDGFTVFHNLYGIETEEIARQFKENSQKIKHYAKVRGYHEIISWNPVDEQYLSEDVLRRFAEKYIELRGKNALCLAKPHFSTNHPHIHLIFSALDFEGKRSMRANNQTFYGVRREMEEFQKTHFPLMKSLVYQHFGKELPLKNQTGKHLSHGEMQLKKRSDSPTKKEQLTKSFLSILNGSDSLGEAIDNLKENGITLYQRSGKTTGIQVGKKSYRFSTLKIEHPMLTYLNRTEELKKIQEKKRTTKSRGR